MMKATNPYGFSISDQTQACGGIRTGIIETFADEQSLRAAEQSLRCDVLIRLNASSDLIADAGRSQRHAAAATPVQLPWKTTMKTLIAMMGCLVAASTFAGRAPIPMTPAELASGGLSRHANTTQASAKLDGVAATDTGSVLVRFADLDLEKSSGATVLYGRLQHAAKHVCRGYPSLDLERPVVWSACYKNAVARAVQTVNHPSLTAVHMTHIGRAATPQLAAN
jgi:UrcA family protein